MLSTYRELLLTFASRNYAPKRLNGAFQRGNNLIAIFFGGCSYVQHITHRLLTKTGNVLSIFRRRQKVQVRQNFLGML